MTHLARKIEGVTSAAGNVFESILADIVRGVYPPKSRLPAERELARLLGASRPTVREALSRLGEWNLLEARRGSGIVVRDQREWCIEVLPAVLRYGKDLDPKQLRQMVSDLLALRRRVILAVLELVAHRIDATKLSAARDGIKRAWDARHDGARFAEEDFFVMRSIVEAADFAPGVWMLNRMAGVYLDIARTVSGTIPPPAEYVLAYDQVLDALEDGQAERAIRLESEYLENHDNRLLSFLGESS